MFYYTPEDLEIIRAAQQCKTCSETTDIDDLCNTCKEAYEIEMRYSRANENAYISQIDMACGYDYL